ncbi:MAG: hypothetical protein LBG13_03165 [Holosporales bacterium]|jgi:hypothetical protein|nr:hypothetical protein [Holosporales bacterium]
MLAGISARAALRMVDGMDGVIHLLVDQPFSEGGLKDDELLLGDSVHGSFFLMDPLFWRIDTQL